MHGTENVKFQESSEQSDGSELVKQAAKLLREELLNSPDAYSSWPPTEKELLSAKYNTPPLTQTFLSHLLNSRGRSSTRSSRLISSMAQDLNYNASYGRKRVPKHIHLGVCVKRKSGSVDLVRWLNHFGHTVSYDEINSIETKLAEDQVNRLEPRKFVPNNIQPSVFVTFVYDNCDHNLESLYNVTLHGTNGIIIQKSLRSTTNNAPVPLPPTKNARRRSFKPMVSELQPYIKANGRVNPVSILDIEEYINQLNGWHSKCRDFVYFLLRYQSAKKQIFPSWKGFFLRSRKGVRRSAYCCFFAYY